MEEDTTMAVLTEMDITTIEDIDMGMDTTTTGDTVTTMVIATEPEMDTMDTTIVEAIIIDLQTIEVEDITAAFSHS